ncbi:Zinc finger protein 593 [Chlorella vulgaris]
MQIGCRLPLERGHLPLKRRNPQRKRCARHAFREVQEDRGEDQGHTSQQARPCGQVWEDVRKEGGVHDGKVGPLGSADRVALDEDLPAHGQHFCVACTRYFISQAALATHERTKPHRRRVKELLGVRPHNQADADWAGGMGAADNGQHDNGGVAAMGQ